MDKKEMKKQAQFMESFLKRVDPLVVINKISAFRKNNIKDLSDEELGTRIRDTLMNHNMFTYITNNGVYKKDTLFFRVRKLNSSIISEMNIHDESDLWEPPTNCVKQIGRLNKVGETLLYTAPQNPNVAIKETHILILI